ncbi:MAG: hypothetical protein JO097_18170 [Acidobacteriaceae bacterium]|nr:hypothetical protein [Acidobacteriaceae bacterium]
MKINPDSPDFLRHVDSPTTSSPTGKPFIEAFTSRNQPASAASDIHPFTAAVQGVSKQDLADPARANAAIDRAVHAMMDREFSGMSISDREHVAAWLIKDPIMRGAVLNHLLSLAE